MSDSSSPQSPMPTPGAPMPTPGALHEIRWKIVCPWLILVKALRVSLMLRVLLLAMLGSTLASWGSTAINHFFLAEQIFPSRITERAERDDQYGVRVILARPGRDASLFKTHLGPFLQGWQRVSEPFRLLVDRNLTWQASLLLLLHGFWSIAVWALFGGAIVRIAALYLTRGETLGPLAALCQTVATWLGTVGAPTIVLLVTAAMVLPLAVLGLLSHGTSVAILVGLLWGLVLLWGFLLAVVLLGLLIGWPLMWACMGVERSDAFDGVSRCYAYVYQKPLQLLFYCLIATILGFLGEMVVSTFVAATNTLSVGPLTWGAGGQLATELLDSNSSFTAPLLVHFWQSCLELFATAYPLACLWPMSVGIYLLQRYHVDATEMDEVVLIDTSEK